MSSAFPKVRTRAFNSAMKLVAAFALSLTIAFSAAVPANAFFLDPNVVERIEFVLMCKRLLLEDLVNGTNIHTEVCGVGDISGGPIHHITHNNPVKKPDPCYDWSEKIVFSISESEECYYP